MVADGEVVALGILFTLASMIYFSFYLAINLGKDKNKNSDLEDPDSMLKSHYPLRFFFLFFGNILMYVLMYQAFSFGRTFLASAEEPFYSLVYVITFFFAVFIVTYFMIYFIVLGIEYIKPDALMRIKFRWRRK